MDDSKIIGFTCSCFDLLHAGHILMLEDAKKQLVVAEKTKILRMHSLSYFENLKKSITINYY